MRRLLRRILLLVVMTGAAYVVFQRLFGRNKLATVPSAPAWTPLPVQDATVEDGAPPAPESRRWVEPVDGQVPPGYPVKANDGSKIFHVPGGRFYDRTTPTRCYATAADAEADGYRPAKA